MRLDVYLAKKSFIESRSKAKAAIEDGRLIVNGEITLKPSYEVQENDEIFLTEEENTYVSRGGQKLRAALDAFGISAEGKNCLDIGASTGGFTDCLLQSKAAFVTAVDSGSNQLHPSLRGDKRIALKERYNARYMTSALGSFDIAVMDVSFISQTLILARIPLVLKPGGVLISLIKPQFELARASLDKRGVVKNEKDRKTALKKVLDCAARCGFKNNGVITSPIPGGDGNTEYLAYFKLESEISGGKQSVK